MVLILSDSDVARSCTASRAITVIRKAIHAHGEGRLAAPPRAHSELAPSSRLTFTAGALESLVHGVRIYDNADAAEQVVAVWDALSGRLAALVLGAELGRRRTGAIGAVALDTLARLDAATLGVIGTGHQAWAQVWAATAVRTWRTIHVFGRNPYVRERFAARCREQLLVDAIPVESPEAAVRGMDAVIVATNSSVPVFETSWLEPGSHVTTLGPKTISDHEVPLDLLDRVELVVTDSLAQVHGHREPYALSTRRMVELGAIMTGAVQGRARPDQITLFCSVGLSGTEVVLAADLSGLPTGPAPAMTAALPVVSHASPDSGIWPSADLATVGGGGAGFTSLFSAGSLRIADDVAPEADGDSGPSSAGTSTGRATDDRDVDDRGLTTSATGVDEDSTVTDGDADTPADQLADRAGDLVGAGDAAADRTAITSMIDELSIFGAADRKFAGLPSTDEALAASGTDAVTDEDTHDVTAMREPAAESATAAEDTDDTGDAEDIDEADDAEDADGARTAVITDYEGARDVDAHRVSEHDNDTGVGLELVLGPDDEYADEATVERSGDVSSDTETDASSEFTQRSRDNDRAELSVALAGLDASESHETEDNEDDREIGGQPPSADVLTVGADSDDSSGKDEEQQTHRVPKPRGKN